MNDHGSVTDIHVNPAETALPVAQESPSKTTPERYRRGHRRNDSSTGSAGSSQASPFDSITGTSAATTAKVGQIYNSPQQIAVANQRPEGGFRTNSNGQIHSEDSGKGEVLNKGDKSPSQSPSSELPKRYRKRSSLGNMEGAAKVGLVSPSVTTRVAPSTTNTMQPQVSFIRFHYQLPYLSSQTSAKSMSSMQSPQDGQQTSPAGQGYRPGSPSSNNRSFTSADAVRRINNPSPLSKPINATEAPTYSANGSQSPAVAAMAALNEREAKEKGVKSRLRRAFSFGSSAEMKRVSGETFDPAADRARARREQFSSELDDDQEAIAQRQEATGLGNGIYSSRSNAFTGSTDNLSISSTASSASLMLRKMGKGMKKGGRSLKGLFRPKSVVGVPSADAELQASVGRVSMVTVEAEREQVNVNSNPHDHAGGGTGFPKLEKNSVDVGRMSMGSRGGDGNVSKVNDERRSIVGGEVERAEVLAAVRRGILKRQSILYLSGLY